MHTRSVTEIPVDKIKAQILERDVSPKGIDELCQSIKQIGVIEPLIVARTDTGYILQAGKRRLTAARAAGLPTVPCIVLDLEQRDGFSITIHENLYRENLNAFDESLIYQQLRDKHRYSSREIAKMIGQSEGYVSQRLMIALWPENVVNALREAQISFSVARELVSIRDAKHRDYCLKWAADQGANYRTVRNWRIQHQTIRADNTPEQDYSKPPDQTPSPPPVRLPCFWCGKWHDPAQLVTINLCLDDFNAMNMAREQSKK